MTSDELDRNLCFVVRVVGGVVVSELKNLTEELADHAEAHPDRWQEVHDALVEMLETARRVGFDEERHAQETRELEERLEASRPKTRWEALRKGFRRARSELQYAWRCLFHWDAEKRMAVDL